MWASEMQTYIVLIRILLKADQCHCTSPRLPHSMWGRPAVAQLNTPQGSGEDSV